VTSCLTLHYVLLSSTFSVSWTALRSDWVYLMRVFVQDLVLVSK